MKIHDFAASARAFRRVICVRPEDIDELGHANNVVWVRWVNEAALAHAESVGWGPGPCVEARLAWVVRRHDIEYLLPALAGEELEVFTWAETLKGVSSLRRTLFRRAGQVLARAETTWVLIDLAQGKPRRVPPEMAAAYGFGAEA
jgi:acyl-CoA thioester hydrolase